MAIAYKEEALPSVSTFAFDITRWAGLNTVKGSQYNYEMVDCKNMSSDNFPYASPRKPREKLIDEAGIKRIYKVEGDKVHYIDKDNYLAYLSDGTKTLHTYMDENGEEQLINVGECLCTNNYDHATVFYPDMMYVDVNGNKVDIRYALNFSTLPGSPTVMDTEGFPYNAYMGGRYGYVFEVLTKAQIIDTTKKEFTITMILPEADKYEYPWPCTGAYEVQHDTYIPRIRIRVYDSSGKLKTPGEDNLSYVECFAEISQRMNTYTITIPESITLEESDYIEFKIGIYWINNNFGVEWWIKNMKYALSAEWYIDDTFATQDLDYGVVFNNRIVGVKGNDIRASALGDFTNFQEYADEAGNASATGAYATDVGSAGDFTGICAYNNVLLLFKKNIVYEMYGSMPYTISELCSTGCIDNDSICEIDGVLYWASPKGIVRYSGGVPAVISTNIDIKTEGLCKAGTDGRKYYVYDGSKIYVYDTYYKMWHIEDEKAVKMMYNQINDLYMVCDDGIYKVDSGKENVEWEFTTKDYTFYSKERKNLSKLWIRADMAQNTKLEIYVCQNSGEWTRVAVKTAERDEMFDFKLRVKKCDSYTLKFKGRGDVRILDIHGKVTVGTSKHRGGESLNVYRR